MRTTRRGRTGVLGAVAVTALVAAGCTTSSPATGPAPATTRPPAASSAPASVATPSVPSGCPTPAPAASAPTDFPHPAVTRNAVSTADAAADATLARQGLAALTAFGGPVSAAAFQHYLGATGAYLTLPVDGTLTADPAFATELGAVLVDAAADAVQQAANSAPCTSVDFTSGWRPHADLADPDWLYALGRFRVQVIGAVTRETTDLRVTYRAAIGDTYDFDAGSTFERFARLADHGRAAVFLDGGLTAVRSVRIRADAAELASPGFG